MQVRELESELSSVQVRTSENMKGSQRAERKVKELLFQQEEDKKNQVKKYLTAINLLSFFYDVLKVFKCLFSFIVFFTCFTLNSLCSIIIKLQLILTEKLIFLNNLYGLSIVNVKK